MALPQQPALESAADQGEGAPFAPGAAASDAPSPEPVAPDRREGWLSRAFLMRQKLAAAEQESFGGSAVRRAAFEKAVASRRAVDVLLAHESGAAHPACLLLREGLLSAARAVLPGPPQTPAEAWAGLSLLGGGPLDAITDSERAALERAFLDTEDEQAPYDFKARLAVLRLGLDAVLDQAGREVRKVARVRLSRALRWAAAVAVPLAMIGGGLWLHHLLWQNSNLALHKPVKASSYLAQYPDAAGAVDGKLWGIGFHTNNEDHPWLRIDLGAVHKIHQVIVYNSDHCCFDRAVPLVIEISTDGKVYKGVARRKHPFGEWHANFAPADARYVKLTVDRTSMLHLSEVEVR